MKSRKTETILLPDTTIVADVSVHNVQRSQKAFVMKMNENKSKTLYCKTLENKQHFNSR